MLTSLCMLTFISLGCRNFACLYLYTFVVLGLRQCICAAFSSKPIIIIITIFTRTCWPKSKGSRLKTKTSLCYFWHWFCQISFCFEHCGKSACFCGKVVGFCLNFQYPNVLLSFACFATYLKRAKTRKQRQNTRKSQARLKTRPLEEGETAT